MSGMEFDAGKVAGEALKKAGGKKGICVNQEVGNVSLDQRCAGFKEGFGDVKVLPTSADPAENESKVRAALASDPAVDTILTLNATLAGEPAVKAAAESGRSGIHIATFDMSAGFLEAVEKGQADFAIDQQQFLQGYLPVSFLALNAKYGLMPVARPVRPDLITKRTRPSRWWNCRPRVSGKTGCLVLERFLF
ncbi:sugar ABC transporter substrate-binding protein [Brucella neotomae]|nr:sugar ABC transporter substrate-binding protein [Brucella neotomae]